MQEMQAPSPRPDGDDRKEADLAPDPAEQARQQLLRMPIDQVLEMLDRRFELGLSADQLRTAGDTLRQQWFQQGGDLEGVDRQTLCFLNLPQGLQQAILSTLERRQSAGLAALRVAWATPVFGRGQAFGPFGGTTSGVPLEELCPPAPPSAGSGDDAKAAAEKQSVSAGGLSADGDDEKQPEDVPAPASAADAAAAPVSAGVVGGGSRGAANKWPSRPGCCMAPGHCVVARAQEASAAVGDAEAAALVPVPACGHAFCCGCLRAYVMSRVAQKKAVGILCPHESGKCKHEVDAGFIQTLLPPKDLDSYFEATLLAFVESDNLSVQCPNSSCNAVFSVVPFKGFDGPVPANERGIDAKPVSRTAWLHYLEHRIRCRACNTIFCAQCKETPYHKGFTCDGWDEYQNAERCRFCDEPVFEGKNKMPNPESPAFERVCDSDECVEKAGKSCVRVLACGCACCGIRDEQECLPCLVHGLEEDQSEEMCPVCYVEELRQAPCIQMTGDCRHIMHLGCVLDRIEIRWSGARISFEFRTCSLCKAEMSHPALAAALADVLRLQQIVHRKALERLRYEGKHLDECLTQPKGEWYGAPLQYALHEFLFYLCHQCKKPYFAGGYQCQEANDKFDPEELICPACQPQSVNDCPTHGNEWLAYKCRFCCNIAQWLCWSNTHFCDKCHKSGTWQKLVTFRTGVNKKNIWEYPQCRDLIPQIQVIKKDHSLNEAQKMEKFAALLSNPETCPLGVRHPPNGFEFGMGCTMCADNPKRSSAASSLSDSEDDEKLIDDEDEDEGDIDDPQDARGTQRWLVRELTRFGVAGRQFDWVKDFDHNGVVHWLGCSGGRAAWANPHSQRNLVLVTSSSLMEDSEPVYAAVGREVVRCVTRPEPDSWFAFELVGLELLVSAYSIRHYSSWPTECLRNWRFQGSSDGVSWHTISEHVEDASLNGVGGTHTWHVDPHGSYFSRFRILQTGPNSNRNLYLAVSGFELFGRLRPADLARPAGAAAAAAAVADGSVVMENGRRFVPVHRTVYKADFDENGILYWLGRDRGRSPNWRNPALEPRRVIASSSELATSPPSAPASAICGRETVRCVTAALPGMWMGVEFLDGLRILPYTYSLRHYSSWNTECLRSWRLEASNDGQNWVVLRNHINDERLEGKGSTATWPLQNLPPGGPWSRFRVFMTGQNSNRHDFLALSGLEFTGSVYEAADAARPAAAAAPAPLQAAAAAVGRQPVQLRWSGRDFDDNGLFHLLGTDWGRQARWQNPGLPPLSSVAVTFSSVAQEPPSADPSAILGKEVVRCVTAAQPLSWFMVELRTAAIRPTHYGLRHYNSWDSECLRSWRLEASLDGLAWAVLREHANDQSLQGKGSTHTWDLPPSQVHYRFFRLVQTDVNSNRNHFLACSGFELWGEAIPMDRPAAQMGAAPAMLAGMGAAGHAAAVGLAADLERERAEELQALARMRRLPGYGKPLPGIIFTPEEPYGSQGFDRNGAVYYFGTDCWSRPFDNPGRRGKLIADSSQLAIQPPSEPAWAITGRDCVRCVTMPSKDSWFSVDFVKFAIQPSHYALRHYSSFDREALRNWVLEGSNNGKKWTVLSKHVNDSSLYKKGMTHLFPIKKTKSAYRIFRIRTTGPNSNNNLFLALSGFEVYGALRVAKK